jgi:ATP-dependent helicase/nuclease subunit B
MRCLSGDAIKLLSADTTVVASSPLLAATVSRQFVAEQRSSLNGSWDRPAILIAHAWLTSLWRARRYSDATTPALLSAEQELLLWQQVIERDGRPLLDLAATARAARHASITLAQYEVPLQDERWRIHHDAEQFAKWLAEVQRQYTAEHWITMAGLWRMAPGWLRGEKRPNLDLLLVGYNPMFPAMRRMADAVQASGGKVTIAEQLEAHAVLQSKPCESIDQELEEAARWARSLVEQGANSVGILVPGLGDKRRQVSRVFQDVFYPSHVVELLNSHRETASMVHIDGSDTLKDHSAVAAALLVLDLVSDRCPTANASSFLRSPFISGAAEERYLRAQADLELRRYRDLEVSLRSLERAARNAPLMLKICQKLGQRIAKKPDLAEYPHWARFIAEIVGAAGWPCDLERNAPEQQAVDDWQVAIGRFASLGMVAGPVPWEAALLAFQRLLGATRQQPMSDARSPVQVLDPDDAIGLQFDHLWVAGLSQESWQLRIDSSPFIPRSLQVEYSIPGASPKNRRIAETVRLGALLKGANDLVVSHSGTPIPAVAGAGSQPDLPRWPVPLPKGGDAGQGSAPSIVDSMAPPPKSAHLSGGVRLIKDQSACPFLAFAKFRLEADGPEDGTFGFDHRDRGSFVHRVLEKVWAELKTQSRLKAMPPEGLERIVETAIESALAKQTSESDFHLELTTAERIRLKAVTLDWLKVDAQRINPFEVVQIEEQRTFDLNGLNVRLRIDRVDRLDDGKLILIDYKSGKSEARKLLGERPEEPQLLVYAAALGEDVDGVLLGKVKSRDVGLMGFTKHKEHPTSKVEVLAGGWEGRRAEWRQTVARLADQFRNGYAVVDPTKKACEYCEFKSLCRVREAQLSGDEDEE